MNESRLRFFRFFLPKAISIKTNQTSIIFDFFQQGGALFNNTTPRSVPIEV
jgi:hypothetical protein